MDTHDSIGLVAYNFEPEYDQSELLDLQEQFLTDEQNQQHVETIDDFCTCNNCCLMPKSEENVCCKSSDLTLGNLEEMECITNHPSFDIIVLNRTVLEVAFIQILAFKGSSARAPDELNNTQYRLAAYRQFVSLMMKGERLGKGNRIVIPSCVVQKIRQEFPANENNYCGFKSNIDNLHELFR